MCSDIPQWWSHVISGLACLGVYVVGDWRKIGWIIGIIANLILVTYGLYTQQYGFVIYPPLTMLAQARHLIVWWDLPWSRQRPKRMDAQSDAHSD